ncbi:uncharacterized protein (DUF2147 family) [Methylopila capsulata]|uniref:Uncharacterized protein (DUF2147 family) n=1 Tax=Methylopila capsulata TaxID=61654 RepID=A0A9W6IYR5_9HYPH|nr:DUF2147 domain-containing protein [Methylopila capsulata]MBM7853059.1 uncharacterized protein (DUF2147 family) [Methylopila capsulata]GLK57729.1 hypothetical protein GCM10008170_37490 [Methylopila capsulata]
MSATFRRFAAAAVILAALGSAPARSDPLGLWSTPGGKAKVKISACGAALCGAIVSLREPTDETGKAKLDINNVDKAKQGRPIVGLSLLSGMKPDGARWTGQIYNPGDGKTYKAYMTPQSDGALKIEGCALAGLVCKTQVWTPAN